MWSRLIHTDLGRAARAQYQSDPRRHYHNWYHVMRLYHHAEITLNLPYDEDLDAAILTHDVIYDTRKDKELRSVDWLCAHDPDLGERAGPHILRTIDHKPGKDNRLIILDLLDIADPETTPMTFDLVRLESRQLYNIDDMTFISANRAVMTPMVAQYDDEALSFLPDDEQALFISIRDGLERIIALGHALEARIT